MLRIVVALLVILAWTGTARAQTPSSAPGRSAQSTIRPGTYDLQITFGGGVVEGRLVIATQGDSLSARLQVGDHASPINAVRRDGQYLILENTQGVQIRYRLEFMGDSVSGTFTYEGDVGSVTGQRKAGD